MSMREYPNSGYVVELDAFLKKIPTVNDLDEYDEDQIRELLEGNFPNIPAFDLYQPREEDTVNEPMEEGKWYVIFDENDLFVKKISPEHQALKKMGINPELMHWSQWG